MTIVLFRAYQLLSVSDCYRFNTMSATRATFMAKVTISCYMYVIASKCLPSSVFENLLETLRKCPQATPLSNPL